MAKLMFMGSNGSENPTKSVFPFILANGAVEAGHEAEISLFGDAVVLMKDSVMNSVVPGDNADPDSDGSKNIEEFIAGTDPNDYHDVFELVVIRDGTNFTVEVAGKEGRIYELELYNPPDSGTPDKVWHCQRQYPDGQQWIGSTETQWMKTGVRFCCKSSLPPQSCLLPLSE